MEQFRHIAARRPVTLREIARVAGVSSSAASVILNGASSGTRVSENTRQEVLKVATQLGYRPHKLAQSLATGRMGRIGFYSGRSKLDCRNPFFAEILSGVFDGALDHGLDTLIHTSGHEQTKVVDLVRSHALDGLILHVNPGDPIIPLLGDLLVPAIAVGDQMDTLPSVVVDDWKGGRLLARHLYEKGHRRVLVKQSHSPPKSAIARVESFCLSCVELGIETERSDEIQTGGGLGENDFRCLTDRTSPATAVMSWSDAMAETTCQALEAAGISIPGDVAVVGFDGCTQPYPARRNLTTIYAPWSEVAKEAVNLLNKLISQGAVPLLTVLEVSLRIGDTT